MSPETDRNPSGQPGLLRGQLPGIWLWLWNEELSRSIHPQKRGGTPTAAALGYLQCACGASDVLIFEERSKDQRWRKLPNATQLGRETTGLEPKEFAQLPGYCVGQLVTKSPKLFEKTFKRKNKHVTREANDTSKTTAYLKRSGFSPAPALISFGK